MPIADRSLGQRHLVAVASSLALRRPHDRRWTRRQPGQRERRARRSHRELEAATSRTRPGSPNIPSTFCCPSSGHECAEMHRDAATGEGAEDAKGPLCRPFLMDLTGRLSNLPDELLSLLNLRCEPQQRQAAVHSAPVVLFEKPRALVLRETLVEVLREADGDLRLMELRERMEARLGESLASKRFRDYVNDQTRGRNPLLTRLGYGRYRLRS